MGGGVYWTQLKGLITYCGPTSAQLIPSYIPDVIIWELDYDQLPIMSIERYGALSELCGDIEDY